MTGQTVLAHIQEIPARQTGLAVLLSIQVARYPQITVAAAQHPVSKTVQAYTAHAQIAYFYNIFSFCVLVNYFASSMSVRQPVPCASFSVLKIYSLNQNYVQ